jgi:adenosylcobinamide-GDP ribazoletransferase
VTEPASPAPSRGRIGAAFDRLRLALAFLTILPVGPRTSVPPEAIAESYAYFPIAGFMIGATIAAEDWLLHFAFRRSLRSALIVLSLAVLTGAVHLDGLADTADALGAGRDRERALKILRDSAIGSFGAIALFFILALKIVALVTIRGHRRYAALYLAPALGRWAMVAVSSGLTYLRSAGAGSALLETQGARNFGFASLTTIVAALLVPSARMLATCAAAAIATLMLRTFYRRWLGGVTGDVIGAAGEIVEVVVLIVMST